MAQNRILKHFNGPLALAFAVIAISTFNYGFDNAAYSNTQAMESFQRQFGEWDADTGMYRIPPYWLSLFNSLNYIGFGAGVIIGSLVSARWGRRWCMFAMSAWVIVPAIMAITSKTKEQIMAARILNCKFSIVVTRKQWCLTVADRHLHRHGAGRRTRVSVRDYASGNSRLCCWLVPVQPHGSLLPTNLVLSALHLTQSKFGTLIVSSVCRGTSTLPGSEAWMIPLGLFFIVPAIVMGLIFFIPEVSPFFASMYSPGPNNYYLQSPRWLLTKDRVEEARASLGKLRQGKHTEAEIDEQFAALQYALEREPEQGKYSELFQGKNIKRTAIVVAMNFFQQATGQAFASSYGAIFIRDIGTVNPFNMTVINSVANLVMAFTGLYLVDRIGRR
jgi:SP family sugar:H+ symporter-like MFS transporter